MKPKLILSCIFVILSISISYAQEPLLLEKIEQSFNHQTQEWKDEYKTIYSYDQNGKMTGRHRYNLDACKVENPDDYCDYQKRKSHRSEIWRYNKAGFETLYTDIGYEYVKKEGENYQVRDVNYVKRETDYKDDSLITQQVSIEKFNFYEEEDRYRQININTTINRYNNKNKVIYSENKTEYIENDEMDNFNVQRTSYNFSDDRLISQVEAERIFYQGDTMEYRDNLTEFYYNQLGLLSEEILTYSSKYPWTEESLSKSKKIYKYNDKQLVETMEYLFWESNENNWITDQTVNYEYFDNGIIKFKISKSRSGELFFVNTRQYDESGREIKSSGEYQDENGNLVQSLGWSTHHYFEGNEEGSEVYSYNRNGNLNYHYLYYTEYNEDRKPINFLLYWWQYKADTLAHTSTEEKYYDYDNDGFLISMKESKFSFNPDSVLLIGCCGGFYDKITNFENRCDGAPLRVNITTQYYEGGSNWTPYPLPPINKEINKYSTTLCESSESQFAVVKAYPNPTNDIITINSELLQTYGTKLDLLDLNGKTILSEIAQITTGYQINFESFSPGIYILKLTNELGSAEQKIVYYR